MEIQPAFDDHSILSGVTCVDTAVLAWPGVSFSLAPSVSLEHVERSYELLAQDLLIERDSIVTVHQVHGGKVLVLSERTQAEADGIVTSVPGIVIGVKLADCCGVLLYDPHRRVVAAVHSGWRGTSANIVRNAVTVMCTQAGSEPHNIHAWLSPCASGEHYEVGEDVYRLIPNHCKPFGEKWLLDNRAAITEQCIGAGLLPAHIDGCDSCTLTNERWHSYRRDKELSGRMLAFIGIRKGTTESR